MLCADDTNVKCAAFGDHFLNLKSIGEQCGGVSRDALHVCKILIKCFFFGNDVINYFRNPEPMTV